MLLLHYDNLTIHQKLSLLCAYLLRLRILFNIKRTTANSPENKEKFDVAC